MNDEYRELWNKVYIKITSLQKNENLPIEEKNVTAENQKYNFLRAYQMLGLSDHATDNMSGQGSNSFTFWPFLGVRGISWFLEVCYRNFIKGLSEQWM